MDASASPPAFAWDDPLLLEAQLSAEGMAADPVDTIQEQLGGAASGSEKACTVAGASTTCWTTGRSTTVIISFGMAFVAGRKRVPRPATGRTALRIFFIGGPFGAAIRRTFPALKGANAVVSRQPIPTSKPRPQFPQPVGPRHFGESPRIPVDRFARTCKGRERWKRKDHGGSGDGRRRLYR